MLMNEIVSAADTLELWKLVNDSVWQSLQRLQREEQARKAATQRAAAAKRNKRSLRVPKGKAPSRPQQPPAPVQMPTTVQPPKPQQLARAAAIPPAPTLNRQQPQNQLSQKPAKSA
jgi:hypothetical protein